MIELSFIYSYCTSYVSTFMNVEYIAWNTHITKMIASSFVGQREKNAEKSLTSLRLTKENRGKRWIKTKQPYFLANQLMRQPNKKSRLPWVYKKLYTLSNTLGCHLWWVGGRRKVSISLKKKYGVSYKVGKESSYLKPDVRSSLKQSFKPYQHMLWDVSNSL